MFLPEIALKEKYVFPEIKIKSQLVLCNFGYSVYTDVMSFYHLKTDSFSV